jgi:spore coat protein CotH
MKRDMLRGGRWAAVLVLLATTSAVPAAAQGVEDFFNGDVLHRIDLRINTRDWQALRTHYEDNTYYPCDLKWRGITVRNVGIRSRGLGSRNGTKPGLRVDIDRYSSGQRFLGLKSFILDNAWQDPSFLKEPVTMELFRRMGQPAPLEAFAQLYINNAFAGVYVIVESIDKDFLSRNFGQNDGVLFEYEYHMDWRFDWLGGNLQSYADIFLPKTHERDEPEDLYGPIEAMVKRVNETSDSRFEETAGEYLNLEDVMSHVAIENAMAQTDGFVGEWGMNNFYFYRFEDGVFSRFLVWDQDYAFGRTDHPIRYHLDQNVLTRRTMEINRYKTHYYNRLLDTANAMSEPAADLPEGTDPMSWFEWQVEKRHRLISQSVASDPVKPTDMEAFEGAVSYLREFARLRPWVIRCEVAKEVRARDADEICRPPEGSGQEDR